jgi:hypothetical protein
MSSRSVEKQPISPEELYRQLLSDDFKELECVDEASRVKEEREILLTLIS